MIEGDENGDDARAERRDAIVELNEDQAIDAIAAVWVGRGDLAGEEWAGARGLANQRHRRNSAEFLLGPSMLADDLEEGVAAAVRAPIGARHL